MDKNKLRVRKFLALFLALSLVLTGCSFNNVITDKVTSGDKTKSGFSVTAYGDIYWTDNPLGTVNDLRKVSGGWRCSDGSSTYGTKDIWYGVNGQYHKKTNNTTFSYSVNSTFSAGAWPNAGMKTQTKIKNAKGETATLILDFYIPLIN